MRRAAQPDYPLVVLALLLSAFGIAMVYSAGQTDYPTVVAELWRRQLAFLALAMVASWVVSRASSRVLDFLTVPAYVGSCVVLLVLIFIGKGGLGASNNHSWLAIGGVKLGQPSELAKITVVLMLARVLSDRKEAPDALVELLPSALVVGVPWILIMLQPDLGTGIVFAGIYFAMLFWRGVSWQLLTLLASPVISLVLAFNTGIWGAWFLLILALVLWYKPQVVEGVVVVLANLAFGVAAPILWDKLNPFQQGRLKVFLDASADPLRASYHVIQSQVAIGSGGWFGKGFTEGTQKRLAFLPAQHTDFIWSVVGEELGFFGVTIALTLFFVLFLRCTRVAARATDSFSSLVAFGLVSIWITHLIENVGMTLNLMPVTGIPLPFFSYGGSFLLASWISVGILVRLSAEGRGPAHSLVG
ncbi:MAG: rod shape-determining protein RodA [Gemmatimonadetes bacterium]|nr:rod shape-determining protein RodA [Gemmatimonadota bacterium]